MGQLPCIAQPQMMRLDTASAYALIANRLSVWNVQARLGCNSELILDEFGEKLLEELDYQQEARNIEVGILSLQSVHHQDPGLHYLS